MFAELLGGEVLSSELLGRGRLVRQVDVFASASASLGVNGSAFSSSSTALTAGSLAQISGGSHYQSLLSASAGSGPSIVAANVNTGFVESFGYGAIAFAAGSNSNVALLSSASANMSAVSGAFKHSPFSVSSPSSAEFAAGGYFLSAATANAFSYTNLPSNEVKLGMLHTDAQSGVSYGGIGVLRYAPTPDVSRPLEVMCMHRPQEVRYMYRPQKVRAAQATTLAVCK